MNCLRKNWQKILKKIKAIDNRCDEIENLLHNSVMLTKFEALEERIEELKAALKSKNNQINNVSDNMKALNCSLNKFQKLTVKIYDERFNLLIHGTGIEEDTESVWETEWESENKFKQFLQNGLKNSKFSCSSHCRCALFTAASYH